NFSGLVILFCYQRSLLSLNSDLIILPYSFLFVKHFFQVFQTFFIFWFVTFFATCYTLSYHFLFVKHFFISLFVCFQHLLSFLKKQISVFLSNYQLFYDIVFILLLLCLYCFQATSNTISPDRKSVV